MQEDELKEIIRKLQEVWQEWKTVDAKKEMDLDQKGSNAEFVKDMVAMANNGEPSFLIIGLQDGTFTPIEKLTCSKMILIKFLLTRLIRL